MNVIFRETSLATTKNLDSKILEIYEWTDHLTAESKAFIEHYYPTKALDTLTFRLKYATRSLNALVGLQGTGKSTLLLYLNNYGKKHGFKTAYIKWTRDWLQKQMDELQFGDKHYREALNFELAEIFDSYGHAIRVYPPLKRVPTLADIGKAERNEYDIGEAEVLLNKGKVKQIRKQTVLGNLQNMDVIFIDMPDYTKMDKRMIASDLKEIQELWHNVQVEGETNVSIVIGCQEELFKGHFFFGKLDRVDIDLLKPAQLVEAYKMYWQDSYPFTEESLLKVAELSKGVFRRFLKYLKLSLETAKLKPPITVDHVRTTMSFEQQLRDMDIGLSPIQKTQVALILRFLQQIGQANQKQIAERLALTEINVARIMAALEIYDYIKRERSSHGQWLVSLK